MARLKNSSYKLTPKCLEVITTLAHRYSIEAGFKISYSKIIEMGVFNIMHKNLREALAFPKKTKKPKEEIKYVPTHSDL